MNQLAITRQHLSIHMAVMAIVDEIFENVGLLFGGKIIDAPKMVHVKFFPKLNFANPTQLAMVTISPTRQSALPFPVRTVIAIISTAPSWTLFPLMYIRPPLRTTFSRAASLFTAAQSLESCAADNTSNPLSIVRPTMLKVAIRRTTFCIRSTFRNIERLSAHDARSAIPRSSFRTRLVISFVPRLTRSLVTTFARAIFSRLMIGSKFSTAVEANQHHHEVFPYWPYIRRCGQAIGLAFQTGNYAVLSHLRIVPHTIVNGNFAAPEPAPAHEQMTLLEA